VPPSYSPEGSACKQVHYKTNAFWTFPRSRTCGMLRMDLITSDLRFGRRRWTCSSWPAGVYVVRVEAGPDVRTTRLVIC